jgi:hypothetical protein
MSSGAVAVVTKPQLGLKEAIKRGTVQTVVPLDEIAGAIQRPRGVWRTALAARREALATTRARSGDLVILLRG